MNWSEQLKAEREALKRIIALFLSLARVADLAAGRRHAIRSIVLWCLRRAEPLAWDCIEDTYGYADDPASLRWADDLRALPPVMQRNSRAEAEYLALIFRAAAYALQDELRVMRELSTRSPANAATTVALKHVQPALKTSARLASLWLAAFQRSYGFACGAISRLDTS